MTPALVPHDYPPGREPSWIPSPIVLIDMKTGVPAIEWWNGRMRPEGQVLTTLAQFLDEYGRDHPAYRAAALAFINYAPVIILVDDLEAAVAALRRT